MPIQRGYRNGFNPFRDSRGRWAVGPSAGGVALPPRESRGLAELVPAADAERRRAVQLHPMTQQAIARLAEATGLSRQGAIFRVNGRIKQVLKGSTAAR